MVINSVLWLDEPLDWAATQAVLRERMVDRFPRFGQRAVDGRPGAAPAWEDDPGFDLDLHVHRRGIPAPGDRGALQELVSDLVATPLDRSSRCGTSTSWRARGAGARCSCACTTRSPTASPSGA